MLLLTKVNNKIHGESEMKPHKSYIKMFTKASFIETKQLATILVSYFFTIKVKAEERLYRHSRNFRPTDR